jgi:hypothetical protein
MKLKHNRFLPLAAAVMALSPMATTLGAEKPNVDTSHAQSVTNLGTLTIGGLPTDIQTVINNITAYKLVEEGKLASFETAETTAATAVTDKQTEINDKADEINDLIAADPLDPQIAVEQANLATLQGQLPALQTNLVNAQADVQNSEIKIALYKQCIDSPIADAEDAAEVAAEDLNKAVDQYSSGGDKDDADYTATGNSGLQSVLDAVNAVTAGNQAPVTTAIKNADDAFALIGAANATVADIQALVGVIDTQLPTLPPISSADKTTVLETVLNGSYERNAIDLNTTDIAANEQAIANEVTRATAAEGVLDGKITTEKNDRIADVNAEEARAIAAEGVLDGKITAETTRATAAEGVLDGKITDETNRAIAAEGVLDGKITQEVADRILDVNTEEARAIAAEGVLDGKITQEVADRIADVNAEETARIADVDAEEARAIAAEGVLDGKITTEKTERQAADATLTTNLSNEVTRATAAEGVLDGKITAETTRATAAEGVLDGKITTEKTQRQAADATLTTNLATEKTERQAADATLDTKLANYQTAQSTLIRKSANGQIHIGENSLITQEIGGVQKLFAQDGSGKAINIDVSNGSDLLVNGVSVATDDDISAIRSDYQAADRNLRNDIDTNTRGVAMVAAMTNTTIRDGMTQGVDFNISQFEGETGFAFGYAHKVNENVQIHGAAASTTDFEESVGRLGVSFQW